MKRLLMLSLLVVVFASCVERTPKVLLYVRGDGLNTPDLDYMLRKEASVMKETLEQSGFDVVVATVSGVQISSDSTKIVPELKLSDVIVTEYAGFIIPCMADSGEVAPESANLVQEFVKTGKPVAAQFGGVHILAEAGVLVGKKYAFYMEPDLSRFPEFENAVYNGQGVIQDGNIITSGICPFMARAEELEDGTPKLTQVFFEAMQI